MTDATLTGWPLVLFYVWLVSGVVWCLLTVIRVVARWWVE